MRLDIARHKRVERSGEAPTYVIEARLHVSSQEQSEITADDLDDFEIEIDDDEMDEIPISALIEGQEFAFDSVRDAMDFESALLDACSDFAQLLIDGREFGGRDQFELPIEDEDEEDDE